MRRRWQGAALGVSVSMAALVACGESSRSKNVVTPRAVGGSGGSAGSGFAGITISTGGVYAADCFTPPPKSPPVRQSLIDLDNTLDQVLSPGPRLRSIAQSWDHLYQREVSVRFVFALRDLAVTRASTFVPDSASYETCATANDDAKTCIQAAIRSWGGQLYRRPLDPSQVDAYTAQFSAVLGARSSAEAARNVLISMLLSPYFVMRIELGEGTPMGHLTVYELAARLSHFAVRSAPDDELRQSAASAKLLDPEELLAQLRRLQQTPAGKAARRLFWRELLDLDRALERPDLDSAIISEMDVQLDAFIDDAFENQGGTLTSLLTSTKQPFTAALAQYLKLELPKGDTSIELDPTFYAGILSSPRFLATHRRATARGLRIERGLICQDVPEPPPTHQYKLLQGATPRERLGNVYSNPGCIPCHQIFDPAGFALDGFDDTGKQTSFDTSAPVNVPDGTILVTGVADLAAALAKNARVNDCVIDRYIEHAVDRPFQLSSETTLPAPPPPQAGSPPPIPRPPDVPDVEWNNCLQRTKGDLQTLQEALVTSPAFSTLRLPDAVHYGTASDSSPDPIAHAHAETQQLLALFNGDPSALNDYEAALHQASLIESGGSGNMGGAGAGGAEAAGAAGGAGGAP